MRHSRHLLTYTTHDAKQARAERRDHGLNMDRFKRQLRIERQRIHEQFPDGLNDRVARGLLNNRGQ